MSDAELIAMARLAQRDDRMSTGALYGDLADRIEALTKEREQLALAICGGEDAPGYANAQTVETLEKVARDWGVGMMEQINRTLALEAKLAKAVEALENLADCVDLGCFCSEMQMATAMDEARTVLEGDSK